MVEDQPSNRIVYVGPLSPAIYETDNYSAHEVVYHQEPTIPKVFTMYHVVLKRSGHLQVRFGTETEAMMACEQQENVRLQATVVREERVKWLATRSPPKAVNDGGEADGVTWLERIIKKPPSGAELGLSDDGSETLT